MVARTRSPRYWQLLWRSIWTPASVYFTLVGNALLAAAVVAFHAVEAGKNPAVSTWLDSLWWGLATVTTVGFGDVVPVTVAGRIIGMILMVTGVCLFVGFTALMASSFYGRVQQEIVASERLTYREYEAVMAELGRLAERLDAIQRIVERSSEAAKVADRPERDPES